MWKKRTVLLCIDSLGIVSAKSMPATWGLPKSGVRTLSTRVVCKSIDWMLTATSSTGCTTPIEKYLKM